LNLITQISVCSHYRFQKLSETLIIFLLRPGDTLLNCLEQRSAVIFTRGARRLKLIGILSNLRSIWPSHQRTLVRDEAFSYSSCFTHLLLLTCYFTGTIFHGFAAFYALFIVVYWRVLLNLHQTVYSSGVASFNNRVLVASSTRRWALLCSFFAISCRSNALRSTSLWFSGCNSSVAWVQHKV